MIEQHELFNPKNLTPKEGKLHTTYKHYTSIFLNQCETLFVYTNIPVESVGLLTQHFVFFNLFLLYSNSI